MVVTLYLCIKITKFVRLLEVYCVYSVETQTSKSAYNNSTDNEVDTGKLTSVNRQLTWGGAVASWLVSSSQDRAVRLRTLAGDILLRSWARQYLQLGA